MVVSPYHSFSLNGSPIDFWVTPDGRFVLKNDKLLKHYKGCLECYDFSMNFPNIKSEELFEIAKEKWSCILMRNIKI